MKFKEGWKKPAGARRAHYFVAGPVRSLCGKYGREASDDRAPEELAACVTCGRMAERRGR